jgi:CDP-glycerol glycerophosphotransferase
VSAGIQARYRSMRERFASREDGSATARIVDIVFRGNTSGYRVRDVTRDGRTSVLLHGGGMRPNGITSSLINLLDAVDHDRFDVSVVFPNSRRRVIVDKQLELNPRVRQLPRVGGMNGSKLAHLQRRLSWLRRDLRAHRTRGIQRRLWDDEWTRCFGSARFDEVIDFSGYAPLFATLLLHAPDARRSIWLHNDMAADSHRVIQGRKRYLRDLRGVFSLYPEYDHLVSVSPALAEINRRNLAGLAPAEKFASARNLTNGASVLANAAVGLPAAVTNPLTGEVPDWVNRLGRAANCRTFVTVGRLSAEKNHARLLDAFYVVHRARPDVQLVVVGNGPLLGALREQAGVLGISDAVIFTGHQQNPHAIMAASDCFVLSSDYEGQPMVLLEALTLGLPVVTVAFGSVHDALPEGSGLIVEQSVDGLVDGMSAYLEGGVPVGPFDPDSYNRIAVDEFYRAIGVDLAGTAALASAAD